MHTVCNHSVDVGASLLQVRLLLRLLANVFPVRVGGLDGAERVAPYHKSVLDWLTSSHGHEAGRFHVDAQYGHLLAAKACAAYVTTLQPLAVATASHTPSQMYAVRHVVGHACLAGGEAAAVLEDVLLSFGFWETAFSSGVYKFDSRMPAPAQPAHCSRLY